MLKRLKNYFKSKQTENTNVKIQDISPTNAAKLEKEGAFFVDVRERSEVEQLAYDVKNILHIPLSKMGKRYKEIPSEKSLIIACQSGNRSLKAARFLQNQGFQNLSNLKGGMLKWSSMGWPIK